ncbi:MAG TPA: sigma-70 family RNA polymerase sigma factor [Opitutaceae bacterium]|nr:sigma-70 family RNA polymerase sigma factor [Opitutaceae bacterium]
MTSKGLAHYEAAAGRDPRAFATTHWSLVVRAGDAGTSQGRAALEELCRIYWYPLYSFARSRGLPQQEAEDLTQGFFEDLLARGAIAHADAARGRFRTFLLAAFQNYQSHEQARAHCLKRGGGQEIVSIETLREADARFQDEPVTADSPEKLFDRKWTLSLLEQALATVRREYAAVDKAAIFDELKDVVWGDRCDVSYAEIARRLGSTEGAVKVAVYRLRRRFREEFRAEVAKTVLDAADLEDEMRHLFAALSE